MIKENHLHNGHRKRLRNRFCNSDVDIMQDYEILEFLLTFSIPRKDTNELAHKLINAFGSLNNVLDSDADYLMKIDGVGENTAVFLTTLPKIFKRYRVNNNAKNYCVNTPHLAVDYCKIILQFMNKEELYVVLTDNASYVNKCVKLSSGTKYATPANVRTITELALKHNASGVLLSHNHPDTDPNPSREDDSFTATVTQALSLNGVHILDHIVIATNGEYYSYHLSHKLDDYRKKDNGTVEYICCPPPPYGE